MALQWDLNKIKDNETLCWVEDPTRRLNPKTEAIIFLTAFTGVGWGIDEGNVEEFAARVDLYQKLFGELVQTGQGEPVTITRDDVLAHVGLWTNVSLEDRARWLDRMFANAYPKAGPSRRDDDNTEDEEG